MQVIECYTYPPLMVLKTVFFCFLCDSVSGWWANLTQTCTNNLGSERKRYITMCVGSHCVCITKGVLNVSLVGMMPIQNIGIFFIRKSSRALKYFFDCCHLVQYTNKHLKEYLFLIKLSYKLPLLKWWHLKRHFPYDITFFPLFKISPCGVMSKVLEVSKIEL